MHKSIRISNLNISRLNLVKKVLTYLIVKKKSARASAWALLLIFILAGPDASQAQQRSRQQLIDKHDQLVTELELVIQQLNDIYKNCKSKGSCLKEVVCPVSQRSLDIAREMRDVVYDLYHVHGRGYLSWVKRTESDAEKTGEYHYRVLGCSG